MLKRFVWRLVWTLLALGVLVAGAAALLLMSLPQGHALAPAGTAARPQQSLDEVKALMKRDTLLEALKGQPLSVSLPAPELSAVAQELASRVLQGQATVTLSPQRAQAVLSVPTERTPLRMLTPLGAWLNATVSLSLQPEGPPVLAEVRLGRLSLPPGLVMWGLRQALEHHLLLAPAELAMNAVAQTTVADDRLTVTLHWTDQLQGQTLALVVPPEDWPRLLAYHQHLLTLVNRVDTTTRVQPGVPLREVLRSVFVMARQRSAAVGLLPGSDQGALSDTAARENRAALVAVALAANHLSLHQLYPGVGDQKTPPLPYVSLRLWGREDFAQHFSVSALMALMVGGRVADNIGLYKEMLDANKAQGGSGFSFNDVAINRAGIRLGQRARLDAVGLQLSLAGDEALLNDADFVPLVNDLPEFMDRADFQRQFGGLKDARFEAMLHQIDARLAELPMLR